MLRGFRPEGYRVFGVLAVYQAMLPLLRRSADARIVNVTSALGSLTPGFASTALTNFKGTDPVEDAAREVVRVARLGPDGPTGTFTSWEGMDIPW